MTDECYGALKRLVKEIKEYRKTDCPMKDCLVNRIIGGNDIQLVESWIGETTNAQELNNKNLLEK